MDTDAVLALDVGGTVIKGAVFTRTGRALLDVRTPTARAGGPEHVVDQILAAALELRERVAEIPGRSPVAAGVVVPGVVDEAAGVAKRSTNLGWHDVPLRSFLESGLELPVVLGHDCRAGALAEGRLGAARESRDYLYVAIGTGIGSAAVLDGRHYSGSDGSGGEIGHLVVSPDGPRCRCGARGCLEAVASASAIAERYAAATGLESATAELVARRALAGDAHALDVWENAVSALAVALAAYTRLLAPELVVVGGGLSLAGESLLGPLERELASRLTFQRPPRLVCARLGDAAGCFGAALSAWRLAGARDDELAWEGL